jgi:hypothetical protein
MGEILIINVGNATGVKECYHKCRGHGCGNFKAAGVKTTDVKKFLPQM